MKPTIEYLPVTHRDATQQPLYTKITDILDHIVQDVEIDIAGLRNKYLDYTSLNSDLTKLLIKEFGYEYITQILDLTEEQLSNILNYLTVIHMFKGTKAGLELCLNLMGISYEIEEWWESEPNKVPDTFSMSVDLNLSGVKPDSLTRLRSFVRQYVYPLLDTIEYTFSSTLFDLLIAMAGAAKTVVNPGEVGFTWIRCTIGGVAKKTVNGTLTLPS